VLLVLGLVGGGLLAVVVVCVVAVTLLGTPQGGRVRGQPRELEHTLPWSAMTTLSVGDCLAVEVGGEEPEQLAETVPQSCDQPHRSEVFAQEQLVGSTFPGDEAVRAAVADLCWGQGFYDYVGLPYQDSSLWQTSYFPTEQNWNEGARLITCIVHGPDPASPTLGSYRDARV
jgi:hypothetical protein